MNFLMFGLGDLYLLTTKINSNIPEPYKNDGEGIDTTRDKVEENLGQLRK